MSTPITPSLSQMLRNQSVRPTPPTAPVPDATAAQPNSFAQALASLKKTAVAQAPAAQNMPTVFKAADIARAEPVRPEEGRILRPGSLLNIRV